MCMSGGAAPIGSPQSGSQDVAAANPQSGGGAAASGATQGAMQGASAGAQFGPYAAAAAAVYGGVSGMIGGIKGNKAAKAAEKRKRIAQEAAMAENRRRATYDYLRSVRLEQLQKSQEMESVAEKKADVTGQTREAVGTANASAAERGVGGRSLEAIIDDYHYQNTLETGRLSISQSQKNLQHGEVISAAKETAANRISDMKPYVEQPVAPVDYFGPVFGLAGNLGKLAMASSHKQAPSSPTTTT